MADGYDTTTPGKSPAFQFYARDFASGTLSLSAEEVGVYIRLLCHQWDKGTLPNEIERLARIGGISIVRMRRVWPDLQTYFIADPLNTHGLINARLERERQKQAEYRQKQADKGKASGASRRAKHEQQLNHGSSTVRTEREPDHQPDTQPEGNSALCTLHLQSSDFRQKKTGGVETDARSKRPMFKGQRFVVFEWMLDDLRKLLGPHFDDFDVHSWFFDLDAKAAAANVLVPQRDGGKWLQEQTTAEAARRGLAIATAHQGSGKTAGNAAAVARFIARGNA